MIQETIQLRLLVASRLRVFVRGQTIWQLNVRPLRTELLAVYEA